MTTSNLKILLVDDQETVAQSAAANIRTVVSSADVTVLPFADTKAEMDILFSRYRKAFIEKAGFAAAKASCPSVFDDVDILVLDYDLNGTSVSGGEWASGLEIARMARAFSDAKIIILLNQFRGNRFDLTMMESTSSWADLDVNRVQIANSGLWATSGFEGFRPWHWPNLIHEPARMKTLIEWVRARMDKPVLESIGLNADGAGEQAGSVPREAWTLLKIDPRKGTFRQLVEEGGYLAPEYNKMLSEDNDAAPRIAAAILRRWIERIVVPMQETLVDAPHLAYLMPWLLKSPTNQESWNSTCSVSHDIEVTEKFAFDLRPFMLQPSFLSSRAAFFYRSIQESDFAVQPTEAKDPLDLAFCEDLSAFRKPETTLTYPCLLPGTYTIRHVSDPDKEHAISGPRDSTRVSYLPQSLFAL